MVEDDSTVDSVGGDPVGVPVGHDGTRVDVAERSAWSLGAGGAASMILGALALFVAAIGLAIWSSPSPDDRWWAIVLATVLALAGLAVLSGLSVVNPGETKVIQFLGRYIGTARRAGLIYVAPFTSRRKVSVRVHNFETNELKVNDLDGNPVNIAAIIVWQVADTAKATFAVEDYADFVAVQAESALRHVAMSHPYDRGDDEVETLRGATEVVSGEIADEVAARVVIAGLEIIEARISNLAYSPEIAQAMLQRQQAGAIIAARTQIVKGAVGMVEDALEKLEEGGTIVLDEERKAAMVSNLLVVLCGDSRATPVVNTGSLYT